MLGHHDESLVLLGGKKIESSYTRRVLCVGDHILPSGFQRIIVPSTNRMPVERFVGRQASFIHLLAQSWEPRMSTVDRLAIGLLVTDIFKR